jgi:hypothetical protein
MKITAIDTCILTVLTPKPMALEFPYHRLVVAVGSSPSPEAGCGV